MEIEDFDRELSSQPEWFQEQFMGYSRYLVGLGFRADVEGQEPACYFRSGFVMEFDDKWYWMTAGHVVARIEKDMECADLGGFKLFDHYGLGAKFRAPVVFDFEGAAKVVVDDEESGLDFAAVELRPLDVAQLKANNVLAVPESSWNDVDCREYLAFGVLGLAKQDETQSVEKTRDGYVVSGRARASIAFLDPLPTFDGYDKPYSRFIGKLLPSWPTGSVVGMSGGPLIGIAADTLECTVIAVQSGWLAKDRVLFSCPLEVIGPMVKEELKKRSESKSSDED